MWAVIDRPLQGKAAAKESYKLLIGDIDYADTERIAAKAFTKDQP
jgi:hypothetical protein